MSTRDTVAWRGYWPAAPTPFDADGALDLDAWAQLLDLYVDQGVHGVLVNGTTGEWFSQHTPERQALAEAAVEVVAGRIPVVVGVSAFTAAASATLAVHAAAVGADGVLTTPPPYVHPSDDEIVAYYEAVGRASDLPLMVYNWPRGTAVDMPVGLLRRIADLEPVVAVKESSGDELKAIDVVQELGRHVRVFTRLVYQRGLAVMRELGGDGSIDGGGVGAPFAAPYFEAVWDGRLDEARDLARRYERLSASLVGPDYGSVHGSPTAQLKAVMRLLGQPGGHVREPLLELTDHAVLADLAERLRTGGIVDALGADGRVDRAVAGRPA